MRPPKIATEQMIALHGFFAHAVAVGEASISELVRCETEIEVVSIHCARLATFGDDGLRLSDDLVAGVMGRMQGAMPGSACVVLDPEEALVWARSGGGDQPLETFVALGGELLSAIAAAFAEVLESPAEIWDARLVEEPELAMLVRTHAPLDTLAFSIPLRIVLRDEILTAHLHLLFEPKYLSRLLSALSAAVH